MTAPVLIWGSGAVGGSIGAALVHAGIDVTFVDADARHVEAMRSPRHGLIVEGLIVEGLGVPPRRVRALLPQEVVDRWGCVLLCVKAHHTGAAARALLPHLAQDGYVVALQNGLTERALAGVVGEARVLGGFVNFSADLVAPGVIRFGAHGAVRVGEPEGGVSARAAAAAALLRRFDPEACATDDIAAYLWGKLGYAALLYAQAIGRAGIVECLERPELLPLWRALAGEVVAVARAEGVAPRAFNGFDPAAFTPGAAASAARQSVAAMADFNRGSSKTHSGVWRDLAVHRRATEVDAHYRPVLAAARRRAIACPVLERLVEAIHAIENGAPQDDDALAALMVPAHA